MLDFLRDKLAALRLKARHERRLQEQLLALTESAVPKTTMASGTRSGEIGAVDDRWRAARPADSGRTLVAHNPHAKNILRLLESYVTGAGLRLGHQWRPGSSEAGEDLVQLADRLWSDFLTANVTHYSFREHARRAWRDGECFLRRYSDQQWPPAVRFVDPETIGSCPDFPNSQGILTDPMTPKLRLSSCV